jgi:hypothetical protein
MVEMRGGHESLGLDGFLARLISWFASDPHEILKPALPCFCLMDPGTQNVRHMCHIYHTMSATWKPPPRALLVETLAHQEPQAV